MTMNDRPEDARSPISVLNTNHDGDMSETDCPGHNTERMQLKPMIKRDGAVYQMQDPFRVYLCKVCLVELDVELYDKVGEDNGGELWYRLTMTDLFDKWDAGDAPGDWFKYIGEYNEMDDQDGGFVSFDSEEWSE